MFAVGTGVVFDGVVIGVTTVVCVPVASGVCVEGGRVPSCFEVQPEQATNSTHVMRINIPMKIFWFIIKIGREIFNHV